MTLRLLKRMMPEPLLNWALAIRAELRLIRAERAVARFRGPHGAPHNLSGELIVSLTSYPPRFGSLAKTLKSLLNQDVCADRTILWLAEKDMASLPEEVKALTEFGLEIRTCADIRSYKKIIPALTAFPEAYIVTADDDVYYPPDWLEGLVRGAAPGSSIIVCHRAHRPVGDPGNFAPYSFWHWGFVTDGEIREDLFPTGIGGVLYPPGSLAAEVCNVADFLSLAPTADDVWLYCMAKRAGSKHRQVGGRFPAVTWPNTQDVALACENVLDGNDKQLHAVWAKYCAHLSPHGTKPA